MNDPGLDEPISNNAQKIERGEEEGGNDDYDQSFLDPRYVMLSRKNQDKILIGRAVVGGLPRLLSLSSRYVPLGIE